MAKSKDDKGFFRKSDFVEVITKYYYVDKSLIIKDLIDNDNGDDAFLFTRPRRFGKSLNISMLQTFFEKTDKDNSVYFKDLEIWKCGEKYTSELGKYPVIYLDFKDVKCSDFDVALGKIKSRLSKEFSRHKELKTSRLVDSDSDLPQYFRIIDKTADEGEVEDSLLTLSRMLYDHHGVAPIILMDEYDVPIQYGYEHGYYSEITEFFSNFLSAALKGNNDLTFAVVTGAMRVAKAGIFTGLNNLGVYSVLENKYSQYFGFTEGEVWKILDDFGRSDDETKDTVRKWYDGYEFGDTKIFNPWSVAQYVTNDFKAAAYWQRTSGNSVIYDMLHVASKEVTDDFLQIVQRNQITVPIDEDISYSELKDDPRNIFSILLATGYLKAVSHTDDECVVEIPNDEVAKIYQNEIIKNVWHNSATNADRMRQALIESDVDALSDVLAESMCVTASFFETADEKAYQILMVGITQHMTDIYVLRSNSKSGYGLYDIALTPREPQKGLPGIIIETECRKTADGLDAAADDAIVQIEKKKYEADMKDRGIAKIDKYGLAFCGQHVVVKKL